MRQYTPPPTPTPAPAARLAPSLQEDRSWVGEAMDMVLCPVCRYDYCHLGEVSQQPTAKGWRVVMPFWGECGHAFDVVLLQHKGQTFASIENVRRSEPEGWPL